MNDSTNAVSASCCATFAAPSARSLHWLLLIVVASVTLSVFSVVRTADFVPWDDDINIYNNPHIQNGITLQSLKWMFTDTEYVHRYMPIGWLGFAVDYHFTGELNPTTLHLGNLFLHTVNSLLVFLLLGSVLRKAVPSTPAVALSVAAAIGALFWSIHPLRVESVAWCSSRIYHIALFFTFTSLLAYLKFSESRERKGFYWLSIVLFLLAALTYPVVVGIPVAVVALDLFPLRRLRLTRNGLFSAEARRVWIEKLPFFLISALLLSATIWNRTHASRFVPAPTLDEFGIPERAAQAFYVWGAYLWKTFWPANLCPTYTELLAFKWWQPRFVFSFLLIVGLSWGVARQGKRWPAVTALWVTYLALLIPVVGLTEHPHYAYDRYSVMVAVLLSLGAGWLVLRFWQDKRARFALVGISAAAIAVCGTLSFKQAGVWNGANTFMPYMISQIGEHPARAKQDVVYGVILRVQKRHAEADQSFRNAIHVRPDYVEAHVNLGESLSDQNKLAEAVISFRRALELDPYALRARQGLGVALGGLKQFDDAVAEFKQVLATETNNVNALHNLAVTLHQMGEKELAMNYYQQARSLRATEAPGTP